MKLIFAPFSIFRQNTVQKRKLVQDPSDSIPQKCSKKSKSRKTSVTETDDDSMWTPVKNGRGRPRKPKIVLESTIPEEVPK